MNSEHNKVMDLRTAIRRFVDAGAHVSIGGFTLNRNPMAAVYEIIRQRITGLHVYAHSNGQGVDELVGAGCVSRLEIAYAGSGRFAPTCIRFRKAVENRSLAVEDYSNYQMTLRFMAGSMGVPFLPTRSGLGTSIIDKWGFPAELRKTDPKIPNQKLVVMENPLDGWGDADRVVLVPAINPDVTILHVQKADDQGHGPHRRTHLCRCRAGQGCTMFNRDLRRVGGCRCFEGGTRSEPNTLFLRRRGRAGSLVRFPHRLLPVLRLRPCLSQPIPSGGNGRRAVSDVLGDVCVRRSGSPNADREGRPSAARGHQGRPADRLCGQS
jgi:acyl CoA:acetate/3-ketoacid CoA transferase alpha subunit